ncbi:hypothetical protein [Herpetosiphon geysericola]|uniref:Uncharacterized protein n=1 Tax=Herpetosiphon geysericola TaxID=70996 RepID=A0A0P6XET5_9CHLR|nr:hypothetical protein [Herpetosiphon geysericola]KPL81727.1 hypothetical protein SE18_20810 [Herpetosiphon geysericola]
MDGLILERNEFLVLLEAARTNKIIGLDNDSLIPHDQASHLAALNQGVQGLVAKELATISADETVMIEREILEFSQIMAFPDIAFITTRDMPEAGSQLFLHYVNQLGIVEQTLPTENQHRLAFLPDMLVLFDRLAFLLEVQPSKAFEASVRISQDEFLAIKGLAEDRADAEAFKRLTAAGLDQQAAQSLIEAIQAPVFSASLAIVRCEDTEIVDAINPAILQGPNSAWAIQLDETNPDVFEVQAIDQAWLREHIQRWFEQLATAAL